MANSYLWNKTMLLGWGAPSTTYDTMDLANTLDHENEGVGVVFTAREDCSLTHANVLIDAVTGTSPYYKVQLWPMSDAGNGQPDMSGTVLAETAGFQGSLTGAFPYTKLFQPAFTSPYSATAGTMYAMIIQHDSGTIDGSNNCGFTATSGRRDYYTCGAGGYLQAYSGSRTTWYGSGLYIPGLTCVTDKAYDLGGVMAVETSATTLTVAGYRACNKITMPAAVSDAGLEMYCIGIQMSGAIATGTSEFKVGAWDVDGNELCDPTEYDAEHGVGFASGQIGRTLGGATMYFAEPLLMSTGNAYYIGLENVSGNTFASFKIFDAYQSECERSWPMAGLVEAAYWAGSSWSDSWTGSAGGKNRWLINPIISDLYGTAAGGGGGGSTTGATMGVIG